MPDVKQEPRFEFTGGHLCLDFANTVDNRGAERQRDLLDGYEALLAWAQEAGVVSAADAQRLVRQASQNPAGEAAAVEHAVVLRDAIFAVFSALAAKRQPPVDDVAVLSTALQQAGAHLGLAPAKDRFQWKWEAPPQNLEWLLWPIARDAAELLTSDQLARVRQCSSETCTWLFLDRSKSHNRRWCEMKTCGNRHKARRYYARQKAG